MSKEATWCTILLAQVKYASCIKMQRVWPFVCAFLGCARECRRLRMQRHACNGDGHAAVAHWSSSVLPDRSHSYPILRGCLPSRPISLLRASRPPFRAIFSEMRALSRGRRRPNHLAAAESGAPIKQIQSKPRRDGCTTSSRVRRGWRGPFLAHEAWSSSRRGHSPTTTVQKFPANVHEGAARRGGRSSYKSCRPAERIQRADGSEKRRRPSKLRARSSARRGGRR